MPIRGNRGQERTISELFVPAMHLDKGIRLGTASGDVDCVGGNGERDEAHRTEIQSLSMRGNGEGDEGWV
eukprot:143367-Rhodomonas_salina.2